MLTRTRKAFTLLELIVVIVILAILALLAIPTFNSIISKSKTASITETAQSYGRDVTALAAFDNNAANASSNTSGAAAATSYATDYYVTNTQSDLPAGTTTAAATTDNGTKVTVTNSSGSACLTLGTTVHDNGSVVAGVCP